jgi:hypothetical protein
MKSLSAISWEMCMSASWIGKNVCGDCEEATTVVAGLSRGMVFNHGAPGQESCAPWIRNNMKDTLTGSYLRDGTVAIEINASL